MKIINLTNFPATPEQKADGVIDSENIEKIKALLLFDDIPSKETIEERANLLAFIAKESGCEKALIAGAPYLMAPLEKALFNVGIQPLYSFSERVSIESTNEKGEVVKQNVFKHKGFIGGQFYPKTYEFTAHNDPFVAGNKNSIINLTQHAATPEQKKDGVIDSTSLSKLLTFTTLPSPIEVQLRAQMLAQIAVDSNCSKAMIGGAPYLMAPLEDALKQAGIEPLYAFSKRQVKEVTKEDGTVEKTNIFVHQGFVNNQYSTENVR